MDNFELIYKEAYEAGMMAGRGENPQPMVVYESDLAGNPIGRSWVVDDGPCGFAWIQLKGNEPFGRWAKKNKLASPAYPSGLHIWVGEFNQSYERKMAFARAFAAVLNKYGINAYGSGRLD